MHILEIPSFFPPYGGEFCLEQAKALQSLGHEVRIISNVQLSLRISKTRYFTYSYCPKWSNVDGISVYKSYQRGWPKVIRPNVKRWVARVRSMFADYVRLYGKPDVVHVHCVKWAGYAAMVLSEEYNIPYVVTEHLPKEIFQQEFDRLSSARWAIPLLKQAYARAGMVVTVSEELQDDLACYFGKDYRHVTIPNVVDVDFYACRERLPLDGRPFRFCCLAIYDERKGYDILLKAFDQLVLSNPNVHLTIAGRGTDSAKCLQLVKGYACKDHVTILGELSKEGVRNSLYESDALVLATRGESQGLVLLEALSTGIPVVSTEAVPKSVRSSVGAKYVPVNDAIALEKAMIETMGNTSFCSEDLSLMARQMASPEMIGRRLEKVLSDAVRP
ncbi:MAG: glycosyltransferase family 4 protein [Prevotella sp.]|nr:glycosyltransferase family 4 protein [Prevotella sp.]